MAFHGDFIAALGLGFSVAPTSGGLAETGFLAIGQSQFVEVVGLKAPSFDPIADEGKTVILRIVNGRLAWDIGAAPYSGFFTSLFFPPLL